MFNRCSAIIQESLALCPVTTHDRSNRMSSQTLPNAGTDAGEQRDGLRGSGEHVLALLASNGERALRSASSQCRNLVNSTVRAAKMRCAGVSPASRTSPAYAHLRAADRLPQPEIPVPGRYSLRFQPMSSGEPSAVSGVPSSGTMLHS